MLSRIVRDSPLGFRKSILVVATDVDVDVVVVVVGLVAFAVVVHEERRSFREIFNTLIVVAFFVDCTKIFELYLTDD